MPERRDTKASVIPSARYSCLGSPDKFFKGRTARDLIAGSFGPMTMLLRLRDSMKARLTSASTPPSRTVKRKEVNLVSAGRTEEPELPGRVISIAGLTLDSAVVDRVTVASRTSLNGAMKR